MTAHETRSLPLLGSDVECSGVCERDSEVAQVAFAWWGCHGLVPWSFTVAATKTPRPSREMPRPCAVEFHGRGYKNAATFSRDATALRRGVSRSRLQNAATFLRDSSGDRPCHSVSQCSRVEASAQSLRFIK